MRCDPANRAASGNRIWSEVTGYPAPPPSTLLKQSWRDFVFAEIWSRPALDRRSRYLIAIAGAAGVGDPGALGSYVHGALKTAEISLSELREAALHVAVYGGWTAGDMIDQAATRAAEALGLEAVATPPIQTMPWSADQRTAEGTASFDANMLSPPPPPTSAYFHAGILDFVFGEMWNRPGLDQRARRWLTLVGVGNSACAIPISSHVWSAMTSGNASTDEMLEFVLQYAVHGGWPRASVIQGYVLKQAPRVAQGLPFEP